MYKKCEWHSSLIFLSLIVPCVSWCKESKRAGLFANIISLLNTYLRMLVTKIINLWIMLYLSLAFVCWDQDEEDSDEASAVQDNMDHTYIASTSQEPPNPPKQTLQQTCSSRYPKCAGKRPWSAVEKEGIDSALRHTIKNMNDTCKANDVGSSVNKIDEDMMFCLSLVPKMRRVSERLKTAAQLRILQVFSDFEMSGSVWLWLTCTCLLLTYSHSVSQQYHWVSFGCPVC